MPTHVLNAIEVFVFEMPDKQTLIGFPLQVQSSNIILCLALVETGQENGKVTKRTWLLTLLQESGSVKVIFCWQTIIGELFRLVGSLSILSFVNLLWTFFFASKLNRDAPRSISQVTHHLIMRVNGVSKRRFRTEVAGGLISTWIRFYVMRVVDVSTVPAIWLT